MSNDLTTFENDDGWNDAAHDANEQILRGTLLKFADWRWTAGQDGRLIPEGTKMVAIGTAAAWVRWEGGKPVEHRMRAPGGVLAMREELGHDDTSHWEAMSDGKLRDPWQNTRYVYFVDPATAEEFTFSTSSMGGIGAVSSLGGPIQRMRMARPGAAPVVELRYQDMKTKHGKKSKPWLKIVDWVGGKPQESAARLIEHNPQQGTASPELQRAIDQERVHRQHDERNPPPARAPVRGDMENDDVPF